MSDIGLGSEASRKTARDWTVLAILAVTLAYGLGLTLFPPAVRAIDYDTPSYVEFFNYRSAGYPFVLRGVQALFGNTEAVLGLQLWIYVAAGGFAVVELWRATRSRLGVAVALAFLFGNPFVTFFHFKIMTDSFALTSLIASVGFMFVALRSGAVWPLAAIGLLTGIGISMRPSNLALAPALAIFVYAARPWGWRGLGRGLCALLLPIGLCIAAEGLAYHAVHGSPRLTLLPHHLLGKALMAPTMPKLEGRAGVTLAALHEAYAPVRALLPTLEPFPLRWFVATRYEIAGQWDVYDAITPAEVGAADEREKAAILTRFGLQSARVQPGDFLLRGLRHWWALIYVPELMSPAQGLALESFVQSGPPRANFVDLSLNRPPMAIAPFVRLAIYGLAAANFGAIFWFMLTCWRPGSGRSHPLVAMAGAIAICAQAEMVLAAFAGVAVSRYSLGVWPILGLSAALLAAQLVTIVWRLSGRLSGNA